MLGSPHGAAERLGLKRSTLQCRLRKLGRTRPARAGAHMIACVGKSEGSIGLVQLQCLEETGMVKSARTWRARDYVSPTDIGLYLTGA